MKEFQDIIDKWNKYKRLIDLGLKKESKLKLDNIIIDILSLEKKTRLEIVLKLCELEIIPENIIFQKYYGKAINYHLVDKCFYSVLSESCFDNFNPYSGIYLAYLWPKISQNVNAKIDLKNRLNLEGDLGLTEIELLRKIIDIDSDSEIAKSMLKTIYHNQFCNLLEYYPKISASPKIFKKLTKNLSNLISINELKKYERITYYWESFHVERHNLTCFEDYLFSKKIDYKELW